MYVSKYVSKDLLEEFEKGAQRYRVGEGFQPVAERIEGRDLREMLRQAEELVQGPDGVVVTALHEVVLDWKGPPTWTFRGEVPELPAGPLEVLGVELVSPAELLARYEAAS